MTPRGLGGSRHDGFQVEAERLSGAAYGSSIALGWALAGGEGDLAVALAAELEGTTGRLRDLIGLQSDGEEARR